MVVLLDRSSNHKETIMSDIITLKQLCADLKIAPREARERLRAAARDAKKHPELAKLHKPRAPWSWVKGSKAFDEAKKALSA
jgi:hypothetical protein